jgi:hypothetical protein
MTRVRADSVRRLVEVTGLGIAATYFLDPDHGAERRRAAWAVVTGGRGGSPVSEPPSTPAAAASATEPAPPDPEPVAAPPEELVLLRTDRLPAGDRAEGDVHWPAWGWPFVVTITICAIAAFAAVGLGIWAIEHRTSTATKPVAATRGATTAAVLADPTARRIIGTATVGSLILRLDQTGAVLAVGRLAPLPPGSRYRIWITVAGTTRAAGTLTSRSDLVPLRPLARGTRITVTRERAGSPADAPHGPQVAAVTVTP